MKISELYNLMPCSVTAAQHVSRYGYRLPDQDLYINIEAGWAQLSNVPRNSLAVMDNLPAYVQYRQNFLTIEPVYILPQSTLVSHCISKAM